MKNLFVKLRTISLLTVVLLIVTSCQRDPLDGIVSNDRQVLSFSLPGVQQVGPANITSIGNDEGIIDVFIIMNGLDVSNLKPSFEISEKATAIPQSGETVDFTSEGNSFVYTVVSESGEERRWRVNLKPFVSEIDGDWIVKSLLFDWQIGIRQDWGWGVFGAYDVATNSYDPANYTPEVLSKDFPNAALEEDNELNLTTTLVNESGNPEGTFDFKPGDDGEYASFILASDHNGNPRSYTDRFRKMHIGKGVWEYNISGKRLTLWQGNKSGKKVDATVTIDSDGNISLSFDNWIDEFTWDHFDAESHIQNSYTLYYNFNLK
ncbi:hypothetical protein [Tenacibaculum agarivorans]|uniref:hypothetical protein n=1 Tax=Tenacibaculum agarivorans TaxID=1908389 RepID=UPI00094BC213|nr:hypothetical protein [Tenacibaculum agarivorans]